MLQQQQKWTCPNLSHSPVKNIINIQFYHKPVKLYKWHMLTTFALFVLGWQYIIQTRILDNVLCIFVYQGHKITIVKKMQETYRLIMIFI